MTYKEIVAAIVSSNLTREELSDLNRFVVGRIQSADRKNVLQFRAGDKVDVKSKHGAWLFKGGTFMRHLTKNVEVRSPDNQIWRVSPSLVTPTSKAEEKA